MPELHPDDATLLALDADPITGVEYIATGQSPYYLEFRRTLHRLMRVAERANDLRVYRDGDLTVGVRAGRCLIDASPLDIAAAEGIAVAPGATTSMWIDAVGALQTGTDGFPAARTRFIPLAVVITDTAAITAIEDRRGEALLQATGPALLGLTATADEINQALEGINPQVAASTLNLLTAGPLSHADNQHGHTRCTQDVAGDADRKG